MLQPVFIKSPLASFMAVAALLAAAPTAHAQDSTRATIEGGLQLSDGSYAWTVANLHTSPIVELTFPHYLADQFHVPKGWKQETTYLVNVGVEERPGICKAIAPSPDAGIAPKTKGSFGMRLSRKRAPRGSGTVNIRFADGTTAAIANVELPVAPSNLEAPMMIGGFGTVLLIFILARRKRRKRAEEEADAVAE